jgi:hypothetical protein
VLRTDYLHVKHLEKGMTRTNDTNHKTIHFRTGRFVQQNGEWFYTTREDVERGPFMSMEEARDDLDAYIYHRHNLESLGISLNGFDQKKTVQINAQTKAV